MPEINPNINVENHVTVYSGIHNDISYTITYDASKWSMVSFMYTMDDVEKPKYKIKLR